MKFKELQIQSALADYYANSSRSIRKEVETPIGRIDILRCRADSSLEIIEVKEQKSIKHAIGQLLSYTRYQPAEHLTVCYFNYNSKDINNKSLSPYYYSIASQHNISLVNVHSLLDCNTLERYSLEKYKKDKDICEEQEESISMDGMTKRATVVYYPEERSYDYLESLPLPEW